MRRTAGTYIDRIILITDCDQSYLTFYLYLASIGHIGKLTACRIGISDRKVIIDNLIGLPLHFHNLFPGKDSVHIQCHGAVIT